MECVASTSQLNLSALDHASRPSLSRSWELLLHVSRYRVSIIVTESEIQRSTVIQHHHSIYRICRDRFWNHDCSRCLFPRLFRLPLVLNDMQDSFAIYSGAGAGSFLAWGMSFKYPAHFSYALRSLQSSKSTGRLPSIVIPNPTLIPGCSRIISVTAMLITGGRTSIAYCLSSFCASGMFAETDQYSSRCLLLISSLFPCRSGLRDATGNVTILFQRPKI